MKRCTKCGNEYPATSEFYYRNKSNKDGLCSDCKRCRDKHKKQYYSTHQEERRKYEKRYYHNHRKQIIERRNHYFNTLNGHLRRIFTDMKRRCNNNPKRKDYKSYWTRGIKVKFMDFRDFFDYVVNDLGITELEQIKFLEIDRINNNSNYERGNIRFVTHKVNSNNRRKKKVN